MPTLSITKTYSDGAVLTEAQLDSAYDSIETFVNVTKLDDANIQTGGVITANIATSAVTEAKLATDSVTTNKIENDAVTTTKIVDDAVTGDKLDASVVDDSTLEQTGTTLNIKDDGVTTAKIIDSAVTQAKRPNQDTLDSSGGTDSTSSSSFVDATNVGTTSSITTTGRPVLVVAQPSSSSSLATFGLATAADSSQEINIRLLRDGSPIAVWSYGEFLSVVHAGSVTTFTSAIPGTLTYLDNPAAGSHSYRLQLSSENSGSVQITNVMLATVEL